MDKTENWIREQLKRGRTEEEIKNSLINSGWNPVLVDDMINEAMKAKSSKSFSSVFSNKKIIFLIPSIIIPIVLIFLFMGYIDSESNEILECEEMEEPYKSHCYRDAALEQNNFKLCEKMNKSFDISNCYSRVSGNIGAIEGINTDICEEIPTQLEKDMCYKFIGTAKRDASLCEKITTSSEKDSCFYAIALFQKDASVCDKILSKTERESCLSSVEGESETTTTYAEDHFEKYEDLGYIAIDMVSCDTGEIYVRNTGSSDIGIDKITATAGGQTTTNSEEVNPGSIAIIDFGHDISGRVTVESSNEVYYDC
ncbi:MAG: hypothetical protein JSV92_00260 [archaeon]|nr:MAG: hypothetical protein JSV92_00260 [archaeon]